MGEVKLWEYLIDVPFTLVIRLINCWDFIQIWYDNKMLSSQWDNNNQHFLYIIVSWYLLGIITCQGFLFSCSCMNRCTCYNSYTLFMSWTYQSAKKQSPIPHIAIFAKVGPQWLSIVTLPQLICDVTQTRSTSIVTSYSSIVFARANRRNFSRLSLMNNKRKYQFTLPITYGSVCKKTIILREDIGT